MGIMESMASVLASLLIPIAYAQPAALDPPPSCLDIFQTGGFRSAAGQGFGCIADYVSMLTFVVIGFAASISLVMLMINGFRYMIGPATPGGSSDAAKKGIQSALVGLALSLLTYIILDTLIFSVTQ